MPLAAPIAVYPDYTALCREVAARIAQIVREKPTAVLGLATGTTPIGVYQELIRWHREEDLDFAGVTCFNLDEYFPLQNEAPQSYHRFMRAQLFDHLNCRNWHLPSGQIEAKDVAAHCQHYEAMIASAGGLDFQLLGIGRSGHIGFNEPGSAPISRTRLVVLGSVTRADAANAFFGLENVPARALTMGIATILEAREIAILATGAQKAAIIAAALEGPITSKVPASFLREHSNVSWHLDRQAASELAHFAHPYRAPDADWSNFDLRRRALFAASFASQKPLDALTPADLKATGASGLESEAVLAQAKAEALSDLQRRLDDEANLPRDQTVLCLSPHPDDDVICCGATLLKMSARGNRVFVAFGVSGANAVRDKDVLSALRARSPRLIAFLEEHGEAGESLEAAISEVRASIFEREAGAPDAPLLRDLKRLVREGEARDACRKIGATPIFLDLPFYGDGAHRSPPGAEDVARILALLRDLKPDLVLLTGEKNDPHGTHRSCEVIFERAAATYLQSSGKAFARWNYRGAWDDYQTHEGDYFSVFDQAMMERKIDLILDHISQLDPLFPGEQLQEFWERARDRNRENARQLQRLGVLPSSRSFAPLYAEVFQFENGGESARRPN